MRYFLGLDGGGTKTAAVILDEGGVERGRGAGGPGNVATNEDATLRASLRQAVRQAWREAHLREETPFAAVCAGVAGYSAETRREAFTAILREEIRAEAYSVAPDYVIAYWGATHGEPGIVVIAGTGAVAYGRAADGKACKADGLGYLLGDRGSGFDLGLCALRHALAQMQAEQSDPLTEAVRRHTGSQTPNALVQWVYGEFHPSRVAALAPAVGTLAEAGDSAARALITEIAQRLRQTVRQVQETLALPDDAPVYPLGGLWQLGAFFRSEFVEPQGRSESRDASWHINLVAPRSEAAFGAALLARQEAL